MSTDATGTATAPAAVLDSGTAAPAQVPDKGDFEGRLRQGGDFAVEQVKNAQREATRLQAKYKDIDPVIDAVGGGDALMNHLRRLNTLVSNPAMRTVIEQFETTGTVPAKQNGATRPTPAGADDADDDSFEEPWTRDLAALRQENATLRADLNSVRGERGVEKVRDNLTKFVEEFPLGDDDRKALADALVDQARKWSTSAQGLEVLKNTSDYTTFRTLALGKLPTDAIERAVLARKQVAASRRTAAATDVPSGVRTQAREAPADMTGAQAFEEACREFGLDPRKPLV